MHVVFPLCNHHLIFQTLPLTPKRYVKNEEIQTITTLQVFAQSVLKSHDLLVRKLVIYPCARFYPKTGKKQETQASEMSSMFQNPIKQLSKTFTKEEDVITT